ncbi:MAG: serine--tRNA ligase [Clostridia bacterium]|nr:serine--tRNA ligase [Clostridia bacterium]
MLDIQLIRQDPQKVAAALAKRGMSVDFTVFLADDAAVRALMTGVQAKKARRNAISGEVARMKKAGEDAASVIQEMRALGDEIKQDDAKIEALEKSNRDFLLELANMPDDCVVAGGKENNTVISDWEPEHSIPDNGKNHVDLATDLKLIDYPRGAKLAGSGYWIYTGWGARLEWALLQFFIDYHIGDGWQFILPPHMLNYECGLTAGQFPKFGDEVYWLENADNKLFMLPTAETALVNYHREEILDPADLPLRYVAYTPCYRLEAGSYRTEERGMVRGHQFNKVEMVAYSAPDQSDALFQEMVGRAQSIMQQLGLKHRVSALAAGDISHAMARTVDIEVYIPSMGGYKEISSVSNSRCYQARRGAMRMRGEGKNTFVHTLNGSGLATSRVFPAILEQYQQPDGSVRVPRALVPYLGIEVIK